MELPSDEWTGVVVFYDHEVALAFQRKFFLKHLALVFHDAKVLFLVPVEQDFKCPGPRKHFGIFHGCPVNDVIRAVKGVSLDYVQLIAVVVPGAVEPCRTIRVIINVFNVDNQSISIPLCSRVSVVEINSREMFTIVEIHVAMAMNKLVRHLYPFGRLRDLEWEGDIGDARHPGLPAVGDGIFGSILEVLLPTSKSSRKVRNLAIRRIHDGALPCAYAVRGGVRLDIAVCGVIKNLPDSTEIGLPVGSSW